MTDPLALPTPCEFRQWIEAVQRLLKISAYRWSVEAAVPPNLVSKFLGGEQGDLRLGAASALVTTAQRLAVQKNVVLPVPVPVPVPVSGRAEQSGIRRLPVPCDWRAGARNAHQWIVKLDLSREGRP